MDLPRQGGAEVIGPLLANARQGNTRHRLEPETGRLLTLTSLRDFVSAIKPSGSLKTLVVLGAIALFSVVSYATTVSVTTTTYQSQYGISYNVTGAFTAADKGFQVVPTTVAASSQPCTWANSGTCRTALTEGHYEYLVLLTLNTAPGSTTTYTVTVKWDQGSGQSQLGQLTVSVTASAVPGNAMTFYLDSGASSFTAPLSMDVVVA